MIALSISKHSALPSRSSMIKPSELLTNKGALIPDTSMLMLHSPQAPAGVGEI